MTSGPDERVLLAPDDGSLGPVLRVADDRLAAGAGYGRHEHRAVDVVAVVVDGGLRHRWGEDAEVAAGDVAVLRAGAGLAHDEVAGDGGARVLQCYLRSSDPHAEPAHEVHRRVAGWVDLGRSDARLWVARASAGQVLEPPPGVRVVLTAAGADVQVHADAPIRAGEPLTVVVWDVDRSRPAWAAD